MRNKKIYIISPTSYLNAYNPVNKLNMKTVQIISGNAVIFSVH